MEEGSENLEPSQSFRHEVKPESVSAQRAQESGSLTEQGLERIYDLKQLDRFLKSVGSALPPERKQELNKNLSLYLEQQVGWNIGTVNSVIDPSERDRTKNFLAKWDRETPEAQKRRISTALELLGDEKLDPKALEEKRLSFVTDVARYHEVKTHQSVKALSDREIREWNDLRTRQELKPADRQRLKELEGRARLERDKALGAIGIESGPISPLLVNSEVRKRYEQLLNDRKATEKIKTLEAGLTLTKAPEAPEAHPNKAPKAITHETLREFLLKQSEAIRGTLRKSGDYRLWILPMHILEYTEKQLIPTITADNRDLDGNLRLIQSMIMGNIRGVDSPRLGVLREFAGMLPRKEITGSEISNLSQKELNQRREELLKGVDDFRNKVQRSGDYRLWILPMQVCDTAKTLLGEITVGGVNQSGSGMIEGRLNTIEPILQDFNEMYHRR